MTQPDSVSRRTVLRTSAVAAGTLGLGSRAIGTAAGTTQDRETFLELFAGGSPLVIARGEALGLDDESISSPWPWFLDTTLSGPEGILAFVPERLADDEGQVGLEQMLVMTSARALEGDLTTEQTGALIPGSHWIPGSSWVPGPQWFPEELFWAEDGVEAMQTFAIPGSSWVPGNEWFPATTPWFPESQWEPGNPPWWEPQESVEAGASLAELAEEQLLLFAAAGNVYFEEVSVPDNYSWDELADAETATVVEL